MTVIQPNSITGINSITVQTGQALNIHDASGNLIRNITSSSGVSTYQALHIGAGTTNNTQGITIGTGASIGQNTVNELHFFTSGTNHFGINNEGQLTCQGAGSQLNLTKTGSDATETTAVFYTSNSGTHNLVQIKTSTNNGGDPFIKFDGGGQDMVVGERYVGTTNNLLVLGPGTTPDTTSGIFVKGTGFVGVGTDSPARHLDIKDPTGANRIVNVRGTGTSGAFIAFLDANTTDDSKCRVGSTAGNNLALRGDTVSLQNGSGTNKMVLDENGNANITGVCTATSFSGIIDSGTYTSFGTGQYVDISSLVSTNVIKYELMFTGVSCGGGTDWQFQLGDAGGVETSGYEVIAGYDGSNEGTTARTDAFRWTGTGDSSYIMDGRFTLTRIHGNMWWGDGHLVRTEGGSTLYYFRGRKELSAALTTIHISASSDDSESFDGGHFKLITYTGTV